jgi:excisionase family DNA binding protein
MSRLLDPAEAAERLSMKRSRVVALARGNALPHVRIGRLIRFPEAALDAWIATHTTYTPDDGATATPGQRRRIDVPRARKAKAVGRVDHGGLDPRGKADPKGALRIVRARGEGHAA